MAFFIPSHAGKHSSKNSAQVFNCFSVSADNHNSAAVSDARQRLSFLLHLPQLSANNQNIEGIWKENTMWIQTYSFLDARQLVGNSSYLHKAYMPMQVDELQDHHLDERAWT